MKISCCLVYVFLYSWLLEVPVRVHHGTKAVIDVLGQRSVTASLVLVEAVTNFLLLERVYLEGVVGILFAHLNRYNFARSLLLRAVLAALITFESQICALR